MNKIPKQFNNLHQQLYPFSSEWMGILDSCCVLPEHTFWAKSLHKVRHLRRVWNTNIISEQTLLVKRDHGKLCMQLTHTACDCAHMQMQHMVCSQRLCIWGQNFYIGRLIWSLFKSIILCVTFYFSWFTVFMRHMILWYCYWKINVNTKMCMSYTCNLSVPQILYFLICHEKK